MLNSVIKLMNKSYDFSNTNFINFKGISAIRDFGIFEFSNLKTQEAV